MRMCGGPYYQISYESRIRKVVVSFPVELIRWHTRLDTYLFADEKVQHVCQSRVHAIWLRESIDLSERG